MRVCPSAVSASRKLLRVTRLWLRGQPISVKADALGTPLRFQWRSSLHIVQSIAKRWRVDEEWWRGRVWREYFKLSTNSGMLVIIFHDLIGGEWFLQRLYD